MPHEHSPVMGGYIPHLSPRPRRSHYLAIPRSATNPGNREVIVNCDIVTVIGAKLGQVSCSVLRSGPVRIPDSHRSVCNHPACTHDPL